MGCWHEQIKWYGQRHAWFGNPDWGLVLPAPALMAYLATGTEVLGAVALLVGLGTRWFAVPLMVTMLVAAFSVHAKNGWQAIADSASPFANENIEAAMDRLDKAKVCYANMATTTG